MAVEADGEMIPQLQVLAHQRMPQASAEERADQLQPPGRGVGRGGLLTVAGIARLRHGRRQASAPAADVSRRIGCVPPVGDIGIRSAWSAKSLAYLKRAESPNNLAVTSGGMPESVNAADLKSHLPLPTPANFRRRNAFRSAFWVLHEWSGSLPVCFVCAGVSASQTGPQQC